MEIEIYGLIGQDEKIRYIGKSVNATKRLRTHLKLARRGHNTHKYNWIREQLRLGYTPRIVVLERCDQVIWPERERYWIAYGKEQGWPLTNLTEGGEGVDGYVFDEEFRRQQSDRVRQYFQEHPGARERAKAYGAQHTPEGRQRSVTALQQHRATRKGAKLSEETKKRISELKRQQWADPVVRERIRQGRWAKKQAAAA